MTTQSKLIGIRAAVAAGVASLLGGIAQDIQQRVGFLDRVARGLASGTN